MNLFRNLREDEIELRVAREVGQGKVEILLYKTARTDANLLDETVGPLNWACQYKSEPLPDTVDKDGNVLRNFLVLCGVALKNDEGTWIWRWDGGSTDSNFEQQKAAASEAFKRACFRFGLGRELYTAPKVIVPGGKYDVFRVTKIDYKDNKISDLRIVNNKGKVVFDYVNFEAQKVVDMEENEDRIQMLKKFCREKLDNGEAAQKTITAFYNFYEGKISEWQRTPNFDTLFEKWIARER